MSKTTTLQRAIPGLGYAVALGFGAAAEGAFMARWGRVGQELTWFALVPALLAVVHLLAPKNARGGPLFGALGLIWAAAALSGLLARWEPLGEVSPLLSLARYALIALAGTLF